MTNNHVQAVGWVAVAVMFIALADCAKSCLADDVKTTAIRSGVKP